MNLRGNGLFIAGVVAIGLAMAAAYAVLLRDEPEPRSPPPPSVVAAPSGRAPTFVRLSGTVEVRHGDEAWRPAAPGVIDMGNGNDRGAEVRTGDDGTAALAYGDGVRVQGFENSRYRALLREIRTPSASRCNHGDSRQSNLCSVARTSTVISCAVESVVSVVWLSLISMRSNGCDRIFELGPLRNSVTINTRR